MRCDAMAYVLPLRATAYLARCCKHTYEACVQPIVVVLGQCTSHKTVGDNAAVHGQGLHVRSETHFDMTVLGLT